MHSRCVLVFARAPRAEAARKRLRGATPLFERCRERIADAVSHLAGVDVVVVDERQQRGDSFGARLSAAFADARARGYVEIVAVPGDVPGIDRRQLEAAFEGLQQDDVVLGPAPDGGVWLIGARRDVAALFDGVPWQTAGVFERLVGNCAAVASCRLLAPLADVDRPDDLLRLSGDRTLDRALRRLIRGILAAACEAAALPACEPTSLRVVRAHPSRAPPVLAASIG